MSSAVDICNIALRKLGASTIMSLDDESEEARLCKLLFPFVRDCELRKYFWSFAIKRVLLPASVEVPAFGYTTKYNLPSDFLRLVPSEQFSDYEDDYKIEGNALLVNRTSSIEFSYVARIKIQLNMTLYLLMCYPLK